MQSNVQTEVLSQCFVWLGGPLKFKKYFFFRWKPFFMKKLRTNIIEVIISTYQLHFLCNNQITVIISITMKQRLSAKLSQRHVLKFALGAEDRLKERIYRKLS
jgi:hypothetical protein